MTARVAVVGGGISGLVSAYRLRQSLGPDADIVLVDDSGRAGGKLRTTRLAGGPFDVGAEAFIVRRSEVPDLAAELGLGSRIVHPGGSRPLIWSNGRTHALPAGTLMGIPKNSEALAGLVDERTLARITAERDRPFEWRPGSDVTVADLVGDRFGEQVVRRSVDPLLGGVYSGTADTIGVRAALPTLAAALDRGAPNLSAAVAEAIPSAGEGPVFGAFRDGYAELTDALTAKARPTFVEAQARGLRRDGNAWSLDPIGRVDGLVLAVSAPRLAELLTEAAPGAAEIAGGISTASSAVVALAFSAQEALPESSGILVATGEELTAKAFTLSSRKWPHLAERDVQTVRVSFGRFGDSCVVNLPDSELVEAARRDLATVTGVDAEPVDEAVVRWRDGLPQYGRGHTERIEKLEEHVGRLDSLEVAGAVLHGVGVPACIRTATTAVTRLLSRVAG
ncbi:protoporphyrinogen oxidase [Rhodococcus sp. NPDC058521]|uniref:protoporphyrinogen oxidase n=1 Tax=Rhodococcus sp. NPDC058521 TaxID=3346536 RepID=UPI003669E181